MSKLISLGDSIVYTHNLNFCLTMVLIYIPQEWMHLNPYSFKHIILLELFEGLFPNKMNTVFI